MATQHAPSSSLPTTGKRKRSPGSTHETTDTRPGHIPHVSVNPLSYAPSTLIQLTLAGLSEIDELPSHTVPDFPHRGLGAGLPGGAESDGGVEEPGDSEASRSGPSGAGRQKEKRPSADNGGHMDVLLKSIHQLLDHGDVGKAARVYGILLQTRPHGSPVDIRHHNLWAIGAEILMREGERRPEHNDTGDESVANESGRPKRWGSAANLNKVKAYFDTLIQQFPYDHRRPHGVSAVDFWLALLNCEVYSTHAEYVIALGHIDEHVTQWDEDSGHDGEAEGEDEPKQTVKRQDQARRQALAVMRDIARRMDSLMQDPPYSKNTHFYRLRAMVSLYVADLLVPTMNTDPLQTDVVEKAREAEQRAGKHYLEKMANNGGQLDRFTRARLDPNEEQGADHTTPLYSSLPIREV